MTVETSHPKFALRSRTPRKEAFFAMIWGFDTLVRVCQGFDPVADSHDELVALLHLLNPVLRRRDACSMMDSGGALIQVCKQSIG